MKKHISKVQSFVTLPQIQTGVQTKSKYNQVGIKTSDFEVDI